MLSSLSSRVLLYSTGLQSLLIFPLGDTSLLPPRTFSLLEWLLSILVSPLSFFLRYSAWSFPPSPSPPLLISPVCPSLAHWGGNKTLEGHWRKSLPPSLSAPSLPICLKDLLKLFNWEKEEESEARLLSLFCNFPAWGSLCSLPFFRETGEITAQQGLFTALSVCIRSEPRPGW